MHHGLVNKEFVKAELWYPRVAGNPDEIVVSLMDVRAADDIYISYDFDRDGWVIKQEPVVDHDDYMETVGEPEEVAFVPAWLEKDG